MQANYKPYNPGLHEAADIFGLRFAFLIDGYRKIKTKTGSVLSLILLIITSSLFFSFGAD